MLRPKKSLGQNFLIDKNIIKNIVNLGSIKNEDHILEVGPGTGNLTNEIINQNPKKIYVVEKDKSLSIELEKKYNNLIKIFNNDILNFDESLITSEKLIIFGNLPYNISTQILVNWIINEKRFNCIKKLILMFQKDVADRIISKVNNKSYGRISIISNWRFEIKKVFDVPNNCFFPKPKVQSSILIFKPKKEYIKFKNPKNLEYVTNIFFSKKRKMINKGLNELFKNNFHLIKHLNLNLKQRPSNLDFEIYYTLTKILEDLRN